MWRAALKLWKPKLARAIGINASFEEELAILLRMIDQRNPNRGQYPDWGKEAFLEQLNPDALILDVGCGNNSPAVTKRLLPRCRYVGLDIGDYNQDSPDLADEYIITTPGNFAARIKAFDGRFDAVISSHNLEHCDDREGVLVAMLHALKPGGKLYLSCPSNDSQRFPSRVGSLNYHDDSTHKGCPPDFGMMVAAIVSSDCEIIYATSRYQPALRWLIGLFHEARSNLTRQVDTETWAFWGFESVIWARKR